MDGNSFVHYIAGTELQAISGSNAFDDKLAVAGKNLIQILRIKETDGSQNRRVVPEVDLLAGTNLARDVTNLGSIADIRFGFKDFSNKVASVSTSGKIYIFDVNKRSSPNVLKFPAHKRAVNSIAFSPHESGNLLLSGSQDGVIKVWDLRTKNSKLVLVNDRKPLYDFVKNFDAIRCNEFSPHDSRIFCSTSDSGDVSKWDMRVPYRYVNNIKNAHLSGALTLEWNNKFNYIATGGKDNKVLVWNMSMDNVKKPEYAISVNDSVAKVSWSPATANVNKIENCNVACSYLTSNSSVDIWDLKRSHIPLYSLMNHSKAATGLLWRTENTLWTVSKDKSFIEHNLDCETRFPDLLKKNVVRFNPAGFSEFATVYQTSESYIKYQNSNTLSEKRGSYSFDNLNHDFTRAKTLDEANPLSRNFGTNEPQKKGEKMSTKPIVISSSSETSMAGSDIQRLSPTNYNVNTSSNNAKPRLGYLKQLSYSPSHSSGPKSIPIPTNDQEVHDNFLSSSLDKVSPSFLNSMLNPEISPSKSTGQEAGLYSYNNNIFEKDEKKFGYENEALNTLNEDTISTPIGKEFRQPFVEKPKLLRSKTGLSINKSLQRTLSSENGSPVNGVRRSGSEANFTEVINRSLGVKSSSVGLNLSMTPINRAVSTQPSSFLTHGNSNSIHNKRTSASYSNMTPVNEPSSYFHHVPSYTSMATMSRINSSNAVTSPGNSNFPLSSDVDYNKNPVPLLYMSNLNTVYDYNYTLEGGLKRGLFRLFVTGFYEYLNNFHERTINYNILLFKGYQNDKPKKSGNDINLAKRNLDTSFNIPVSSDGKESAEKSNQAESKNSVDASKDIATIISHNLVNAEKRTSETYDSSHEGGKNATDDGIDKNNHPCKSHLKRGSESHNTFKANLKSIKREYFAMMGNNEFLSFVTKAVKDTLEFGDLTDLLRIIYVIFFIKKRALTLINLLVQLDQAVRLSATFKIIKYYKVFKTLLSGLVIDVESFLTDIDYKNYLKARRSHNLSFLRDIPDFYYSYSIFSSNDIYSQKVNGWSRKGGKGYKDLVNGKAPFVLNKHKDRHSSKKIKNLLSVTSSMDQEFSDSELSRRGSRKISGDTDNEGAFYGEDDNFADADEDDEERASFDVFEDSEEEDDFYTSSYDNRSSSILSSSSFNRSSRNNEETASTTSSRRNSSDLNDQKRATGRLSKVSNDTHLSNLNGYSYYEDAISTSDNDDEEQHIPIFGHRNSKPIIGSLKGMLKKNKGLSSHFKKYKEELGSLKKTQNYSINDNEVSDAEDEFLDSDNELKQYKLNQSSHFNEPEASSSDLDELSEDNHEANPSLVPRKTRLSTTENDSIPAQSHKADEKSLLSRSPASKISIPSNSQGYLLHPHKSNSLSHLPLPSGLTPIGETKSSSVSPTLRGSKHEESIKGLLPLHQFSERRNSKSDRRSSFSERQKTSSQENKIVRNASFSYSTHMPSDAASTLRSSLPLNPKFGSEIKLRKNSETRKFKAIHSNLTRQLTGKEKGANNGAASSRFANTGDYRIGEFDFHNFDSKPWKVEVMVRQACNSAQAEGDITMLSILTSLFYDFFQKRLKQQTEYDFSSCVITPHQARCWLSAFIDLLRIHNMHIVSSLLIKHSKVNEIKEMGLINTEIKKFCPHCKKLIIHESHGSRDARYDNWFCGNCHKSVGNCCYCNTRIKGLSVGFLHCGHQGHTSCMKEWFIEENETECPGCGEVPQELEYLVNNLSVY